MKKQSGFRKKERKWTGQLPVMAAAAAGAAVGMLVAALLMTVIAASATAGILQEEIFSILIPAAQAVSILSSMAASELLSAEHGLLSSAFAGSLVWMLSYGVGLCLGCTGIGSSGLLFLGMIPICLGLKTLWFRKNSKAS